MAIRDININTGKNPKRYTVIDSLMYAKKYGIFWKYNIKTVVSYVVEHNLNSNQNLSREIYDLAKAYKQNFIDRDDAENNIIKAIERRAS